MSWKALARGYVLVVVVGIALLDAVTGLRLALSSDPFGVIGHDTLWSQAGGVLASGSIERMAAESMLRRLGAFSILAGTTSLVWVGFARRQPKLLSALLLVYTFVGPAFFSVDAGYFAGTRYFEMKQVISALWAIALLAHFGIRDEEA